MPGRLVFYSFLSDRSLSAHLVFEWWHITCPEMRPAGYIFQSHSDTAPLLEGAHPKDFRWVTRLAMTGHFRLEGDHTRGPKCLTIEKRKHCNQWRQNRWSMAFLPPFPPTVHTVLWFTVGGSHFACTSSSKQSSFSVARQLSQAASQLSKSSSQVCFSCWSFIQWSRSNWYSFINSLASCNSRDWLWTLKCNVS